MQPSGRWRIIIISRLNQLEDEKRLIEGIRRDPQRFGILYEKYYPVIFNYVLRRTGEFDVSRDITSEVFLKSFLKIRRFRWKGVSIGNWFYRIATNEVNRYYRSKKYRPEILADAGGFDLNELADPSSLAAEQREAERRLNEHRQFREIVSHLSGMSAKYQEVISLRYFEQLGIREISQIVGRKEGTVKSLISRGLDKLRKLMQERNQSDESVLDG